MNKLNLFAPQWQCSGETTEIHNGSIALKNYLAQSSLSYHDINVDLSKNCAIKNDILGYDIILSQLLDIEQILHESTPDKVFVLGGGCGIEVPIVSYLIKKYSDITLFWFDAHGDLNSPQSSHSKHFHGMPLRFLTDPLVNIDKLYLKKISPTKVNLLGARDLDPAEKEYINKSGINVITVDEIIAGALFDSIDAPSSKKAYIHIDLDVLDPNEYENVKCPSLNGIRIRNLYDSLNYIKDSMDIVGISILENTEVDKLKIDRLSDIIDFATNI